MQTRLLLNAGLLLLIGAALWLALRAPDPHTANTHTRVAISDLSADRVTRITLTRHAQAQLQLEKRGAQWFMTQPYAVMADNAKAAFLLEVLNAKSDSHFTAAAADLSQYGLQPPRVVLTLNDAVFNFGASQPVTLQRYVQHGGKIFLIFDNAYPHLLANPAHYVSPRLVDADTQIASIATPGLRVEQKDNQLTATPAGGSADALARFIENWRNAQGAVSEHPPNTGDHKDSVISQAEKITITDANGQIRQFAILARGAEWQLARLDQPLVYRVSDAVAQNLLQITPPPASGSATATPSP